MCECGANEGSHYYMHIQCKPTIDRVIGVAIDCGGSVEYIGDYRPDNEARLIFENLAQTLALTNRPLPSSDCICQGLYQPVHCPVHGTKDRTNA